MSSRSGISIFSPPAVPLVELAAHRDGGVLRGGAQPGDRQLDVAAEVEAGVQLEQGADLVVLDRVDPREEVEAVVDVDAEADAGHEPDVRRGVGDVDVEVEDGVEPEAGAGRVGERGLAGDGQQHLDALGVEDAGRALRRPPHLGLAEVAPDVLEQGVDLGPEEGRRVVLLGVEEVDDALDLVGDVVEDDGGGVELGGDVRAHDRHLAGQGGDLLRATGDEPRGLDGTVGEGAQVRLQRLEVPRQPHGVEVVGRVGHGPGDGAGDVDGPVDRGGLGRDRDGQRLVDGNGARGGDVDGIAVAHQSGQWDRRSHRRSSPRR